MPPLHSLGAEMPTSWPSYEDLISPSPSPTLSRRQKQNGMVAKQTDLKARETLRIERDEAQEDEVETGLNPREYGTGQRQHMQLSTSTHQVSKNSGHSATSTTSVNPSTYSSHKPACSGGPKIPRNTPQQFASHPAALNPARNSLAAPNIPNAATGWSDSRPALNQTRPQNLQNSACNKTITSDGSFRKDILSLRTASGVEVAAAHRSRLVSGVESRKLDLSQSPVNGRNINTPAWVRLRPSGSVNHRIAPVVPSQENISWTAAPHQDSGLKLATVAPGAPNSLWSRTPTFGDLITSDIWKCLTTSQKQKLVRDHSGYFWYHPNPPRQQLIRSLIQGQDPGPLLQTPKNHASFFPQPPFEGDSRSLDLDPLSRDILRFYSENTSTSRIDKGMLPYPNPGTQDLARSENTNQKGESRLNPDQIPSLASNASKMPPPVEGNGFYRERPAPINDSLDPSKFYGKQISMVSRPYQGDSGPSDRYYHSQSHYQPSSAKASVLASQEHSGLQNLERFKYNGPPMKQNQTQKYTQNPANPPPNEIVPNYISNLLASPARVQAPSKNNVARLSSPSKPCVVINSQVPPPTPALPQNTRNIHQDEGYQPTFWSSARVEIPASKPESLATKPFDPRVALNLKSKDVPKKRGRPFQTPEAAARAAKAARIAGKGNGEIEKKKRPGRPMKSSKHVEVPVPEPNFMVFVCEWEGCVAELHNAETLRLHLHVMHGRTHPATNRVSCLWKGCYKITDIETEDGETIELREKSEFKDSEKWKAHLEKTHIDRVLRAQGDGPRSQDLSWPRKKGERETAPWLFDESTGKQATPSVRYQEIDQGIAKQVNAKRFKKGRSNLDVVYDLIEGPGAHKRARTFDKGNVIELD